MKVVPKILMVGPGRIVRGGISSVVDSYYELGLDKETELTYIASMQDGNKLKKLVIAFIAYVRFGICLKKNDIVHIHMAAQSSFSRKALFVRKAKKAGKRVIIHEHAADFDEFFFKQSNEEKRKSIKSVFAMADKVIVLSDEWAEFYGNNVCDQEKLKVLYNGVILPGYKRNSYDDENVLFLGRLGYRKGSYDLIKAIPDIVKIIPTAKFFLCGDGEVEKSKQLAHYLGIEKNVEFLGWIRNEDKVQYLKKCSTFILPSYHEGMPMSVLEAMSYGIATVSTNAGGIPQIIENNINGIRISAGDISAIANTLIELLANKQRKKELGNAARKRIEERFNAENNISILLEIYKELLK